ncbi:superoxide dismutase [Candidatus Nitrososphaera sp. FF02]|uniref:superoxide dismutase n=1 Tax=Candidatus Nitrososphaera sp. FF02 TaxID=3398226 RepID=UPI0039EB77CC
MANFTLPPLPYAHDALEPYIDATTMQIHHGKHHQAYTDGLNKALGSLDAKFQSMDVVDILKNIDTVPDTARGAVNFHGGGYNNHALFWNNMKKGGGGEPSGELADAIKKAFGSFADFKTKFSQDSTTLQGSGWGWLAKNASGGVQFVTMPNQTSVWTRWSKEKLTPLLGLDVWEHAYYLKYQNKRADYVAAWWNVVNWDEVAKRFKA